MNMKKLSFILLIIVVFFSCQNKGKHIILPVEKVYFVSFWTDYDLYDGKYNINFHVNFFRELDSNFVLKFYEKSPRGNYYYTEKNILEDSIKQKISNIIQNYPNDTSFIYERAYERTVCCDVLLIFQKNDSVNTCVITDGFDLPEDLSFLCNIINEYSIDYMNSVIINVEEFKSLFEKFETIALSQKFLYMPPPPLLKKIIH